MSDFPPSLLEILMNAQITDNVRVEESPIVRPNLSLVGYVNSKLESIVNYRDGLIMHLSQLKATGVYTPEQVLEWFHTRVPSGWDMRGKLEEGLTSKIQHINHILNEISDAAQRLQNKGFFSPDGCYLPRSLIELEASSNDFKITDWEDIRYDSALRGFSEWVTSRHSFIKPRNVNILSMLTLLKNLGDYEGKLVVTKGVLVGQGHESHNIPDEGYYQTEYAALLILEDVQTGKIIEIEGLTSNSAYAKKVLSLGNGQNRFKSLRFCDVSAYLDASKTKGYEIVVGGVVYKGKLVADMFVTPVGGEKQIFAYVLTVNKLI